MRSLTLLFASLTALSLPVVAYADSASSQSPAPAQAQAPALDPTVARLLDAKSTVKWNYSGRDGRYGHAEALVAAPAEKVAKAAFEFHRYRELHRKFATARVIAKDGDSTDVYMRYPVQIGPMKIEFYEVMRFGDDLKQMVLQGAPTAELKLAAIKGGMSSLRMSGIKKVLEGTTTTEEIVRVTMAD